MKDGPLSPTRPWPGIVFESQGGCAISRICAHILTVNWQCGHSVRAGPRIRNPAHPPRIISKSRITQRVAAQAQKLHQPLGRDDARIQAGRRAALLRGVRDVVGRLWRAVDEAQQLCEHGRVEVRGDRLEVQGVDQGRLLPVAVSPAGTFTREGGLFTREGGLFTREGGLFTRAGRLFTREGAITARERRCLRLAPQGELDEGADLGQPGACTRDPVQKKPV